jgi:N-acetyltransferase 10
MGPALALSLLDPKLTWADAEAAAAAAGQGPGGAAGAAAEGVVLRGDGSALNPYDLKRLQVSGVHVAAVCMYLLLHGGGCYHGCACCMQSLML